MTKLLTPIMSHRAKCLDCCLNQRNEVKHCGAVACPCWPYRFGKRPTSEDKHAHLQAKANQDERNRLMQERQQRADS